MDKTIVVLGAGGMLGSLCVEHFSAQKGCEVIPLARKQCDLAKNSSIRKAFRGLDAFDVVINAAALTNVDGCEDDPKLANQINGHAVGLVGEIAAEEGAQVIHVSTDYVFDGKKDGPYSEEDAPNPVSVYGSSKLLGEEELFESFPDHLVVRTSWLYGPGKAGFPEWVIRQALGKKDVKIVADKVGSATYAPDLVRALEAFVFSEEPFGGVLHFSNTSSCSWREWAQACVDGAIGAGLPIKAKKIGSLKMAQLAKLAGWKAQRPRNSVFSTEKFTSTTGQTPRAWDEALTEYVGERLAPALLKEFA